jgi:hypothetical protein
MPIRDSIATVTTVGQIASSIVHDRLWPPTISNDPRVIPTSAEAITPDWLSAVLCARTPYARVMNVHVSGGDDGTSSRRALDVVYNDAGVAAGLATKLFSKSTATIGSCMLLGLTGIAEGESVFYNHARADLQLRSPRADYSGYAKLHAADMGREVCWKAMQILGGNELVTGLPPERCFRRSHRVFDRRRYDAGPEEHDRWSGLGQTPQPAPPTTLNLMTTKSVARIDHRVACKPVPAVDSMVTPHPTPLESDLVAL